MAHLKTSLRHAMMGNITTDLTSTSRLLVYTGSQPANTASPTGTLLATFTLAATPGSDTNGVYTFTNPSNVTAAASGTPGYFRIIDGTTDDGTHTQIQGSVATPSGGEINFPSTIASGGTVGISSLTFTEGNA